MQLWYQLAVIDQRMVQDQSRALEQEFKRDLGVNNSAIHIT